MFTLGIFTTHLPYIALVVFYAFFWIFGVNKASSGELQFSENKILIEISAGENFVDVVQKGSHSFQSHIDQGLLPPNYNVTFTGFQKLKHKGLYIENRWQHINNPGLFSRPPPYLS